MTLSRRGFLAGLLTAAPTIIVPKFARSSWWPWRRGRIVTATLSTTMALDERTAALVGPDIGALDRVLREMFEGPMLDSIHRDTDLLLAWDDSAPNLLAPTRVVTIPRPGHPPDTRMTWEFEFPRPADTLAGRYEREVADAWGRA